MADRLRILALGVLACALAVLMVAGAAAADDTDPSDAPTADPSPSETPTPSETPSPTPSETPTETPTPSPSETLGGVPVDDAVLRWGVNNESNNKAFAPRTYNFFSAGLLPDPGKGGATIKEAQWRASAGNARIEKWNGSAWQPATWAGLSTDSAGAPLTSPTEGRFSNHTFVMSGGTGTVDAAAGTARITWDGDVTVLYYSGMSFFHLSDPVLEVEAGHGTVTAVLHGYRSSQTDQGVWEEVAAHRVTLADLPAVDLAGEQGFVSTPAYAGVLVTGVPQVTGGADTGSFPQSFVNYLDELGAAAFWYSSGASTDPFKIALPMAVSYDASAPVVVPEPSDQPSAHDSPDVAEPTAVPPPTTRPVPTGGAVPLPVGAAPPAAAVPPVDGDLALLARPATDVRLTSSPAGAPPGVDPSATRLWCVGGGLLLAAALVLLVPVPTPARDATRVAPERKPR